MIIRHLVKIEGCNLEGIEAETADITGDGEIDLVDVNRLINYIVYGKWEYTEVKTPEAPKIEVISEDENAGCYIGKVEVKIEPNSIEEGQRTIYKITGDKTQEETEIKRGEKITLEEEGDYLITAYTYGKAGNRSKGANILIKIRGKYTISYKPGEKGLFSEQTTEEVRYGENTPEFKGQIKGEKGYMFVGWEPKLEEKVTKNVIYTAKWEEIEYKVTFGPNGGDYTIPSEGNAQIKTEITQTNTEGNNNYKLEYVWSQDGEKHPEEGWTEFTNGSEIKKDDITEPGTYYVWVKITDEDGNVVKIIRSDPFIITGPENEANQIKIIPNKTGWTNENVEITIIYGKNLTQNKTVICTGTEGVDFEIIGEERVVVKNNEKQLTVTAEDAAGNKVVATLQINNIDRIKPIVGMSPNGGEHYTMPTTGNAKISSTLAARDLEKTQTDGQSDLGVLQYAWSQSRDNEPEEGWETFTNGSKVEKSDITEPGIWYLWTKVIDNAGNRAEAIKVSNPFVITSNTDPANQIILTPDKTEWTNEDVTVKVTYGANLTENRKLTCTGTSGEDYIVNGLQNVVVKRNKKTITAEAEDVAGNKIVATLKIENIDKDLPIVEMIPNIGIYTMPTVGKAKISTRIIAEDVGDSGLDVLQYAWSTSNTTIPSTGWKNFTNGETVTKTDVDGEGRWYIWVKILDKVGNSCLTVKSNAFRVKPNTDVNSQITLTPDITEWTNRDVTVTAVYGKTLTQNKRLTATGIAGTDFVENGSERIIIKTNQTVTAKAQDAAGNEIQKTLTISNIDKTPPTVTITSPSKDWTKDNISVNLSFADVGSGFKNYQYALTNSATAPSSYGQAITNSTGTVTISNAGEWYLHVKATDNVGNTTGDIVKGPYKIDRTAPTVRVTPETKDWTKDNISISLNFADTGSGFKNYQYTLTNSESAPSSYGGVITNSTGTVTISTTGEWYLHVKAEDNAKNTTGDIVKGPYKVDKAAPEITEALRGTLQYEAGDIDLSITSKDEVSGFCKIEWYYKVANSSGRYISVKDEADTPMNGANSGLKTAVKKSKKLSLLPDTTYSIYAIIYDVAGNHRESNTITVTTNPARWRNERTKEEYPHMYYALARVDSGDTLTLLCSYTDDYIANVNDDITINLAGYTLTKEDSDINIKANKTVNLIRTGTIKTTDLGVIIENSGTLNISNGSYSSTSGNIIYNYSGGNVSISNGTFTSSADNYPMIYNYGGINITGGSYSSTGSNVIYNRNNGNVSISNGTLTSNVHCIDNRSTLTVRGGEIKSTGDDCNGIYNSGTLTVNGGTIEASKHNAILNYDTTTINGGVIWSTANDQAALGNADGIVYINGGTIKQTGGGIGIFNTAMNGHISSAIITGGTITSTGDTAIVHQTEGELTITGNSTRITNSSINKACITIENSTSVTIGSATSTSTSYPYIYNSAGIAIDIMAGARGTNVKIYSGLIEATNGYAV